MKKTICAAAAGAFLILPAAAGAHVTVQPPEVPAGTFTRIDVRVPNEEDDASTTKVEVQLPDGFYFASFEPVPGWSVEEKTEKLDDPVTIEEGFEATEQVTTVTWTADGDGLPPGSFQDFGLSVLIPDAEGETLTFPAIQTYDNGDVVRWIGPPDADEPASTVSVDEAEDDHHGAVEDDGDEADPESASVTNEDDDDGNGMAIAALIMGALGFAAGGASLARTRKG